MAEIARNLSDGIAPGMGQDCGWLLQDKPCCTGRVTAVLPAIAEAFAVHSCRNNQLLIAALAQIRPQVDQAVARFGRERVAVVLGTSTAGLDEADHVVSREIGEHHDFRQEPGDPSHFLAQYLALTGPAYTLLTACSSSARALISGKRLIESGLADVAIVGGVDTLSRMPLNGFDSLESLSPQRCTPFSAQRDGITIGEGAALMLLTRDVHEVAICGTGESSDAYHMSAPHPQGEGAVRAITMAMQQAGLAPDSLGYINLHGTATRLNDQIEAEVIGRLFGDAVPCSSTKHLTGHTLGAAGICEAALCWLLLTDDIPLPAQDFSQHHIDDSLPVGYCTIPPA